MNGTISAQEYESRQERVREFLRERDLGALFVYFATGGAQMGPDRPRGLSLGLGQP